MIFGAAQFINPVGWFLALSYAMRAMMGMADGIGWASVVTILLSIWPEEGARIMSASQTIFGVGWMIGPAIGTFLFKIQGFFLPFLIIGSLTMILGVLSICFIPKIKGSGQKSTMGIFKVLKVTA